MVKKEMIAMLLAGGQGSRLGVLTAKVAKPAVAFGGKYRIIDFPLSNCINSGIDTVGVLTQYQPLRLNTHIGIGIPWDLDRNVGGVTVLPPYEQVGKTEWYTGTANAIFQNLSYMESFNPDYVLILSGDHIYKMDYEVMLDFHRSHNADVSIAVMPVPQEEASRFGIVVADSDGKIREFQEKPEHPKSTLASMGVYVFSTDALVKYLEEDEADPNSDNDFGKNIIPAMLRDGRKIYTYLFGGYWRDVGTLDSFWAANMDALGDVPELWLNDPGWKIYYSHSYNQPQYVGEHADIHMCICGDGNEIDGRMEHSVIFNNIIVEEGAEIKDSIIMSDCVIRKGAKVEYAIIDSDVEIQAGAVIGGSKDNGPLTVVGKGVTIHEGARVNQGEIVTEDR